MDNQYIFAIHKPLGISSFAVIKQLRAITGIRTIGHAGTLDPLAEGVLVVGITRQGTRQLHQLLQCDKEYLATIKLGATTATGDSEAEEEKVDVTQIPSKQQVQVALNLFIGEGWQKPHAFSAVKIKGRPAYKLARSGQAADLPRKKIVIADLQLLSYDYPVLKIRAVVSSGVYIRSLAEDIGDKLKTGAYLTRLVRTRVGEFELNQALTIDQFQARWEKKSIIS